MGYPIGPHYAEQSNVTQAHKLKGKLLLIVGELDRNVDPSSTMQVANALVKADKDFDLLVIPGAGHGAAESAYGSWLPAQADRATAVNSATLRMVEIIWSPVRCEARARARGDDT